MLDPINPFGQLYLRHFVLRLHSPVPANSVLARTEAIILDRRMYSQGSIPAVVVAVVVVVVQIEQEQHEPIELRLVRTTYVPLSSSAEIVPSFASTLCAHRQL